MELTEEQSSIVQTSGEAKLLVTAGPGTGKTHVLIYRLAELVGERSIPPSELLVLSFSRAAVREIRDRLHLIGGDAQYVRAMTFDSFATRFFLLQNRQRMASRRLRREDKTCNVSNCPK